MLFSEPKISQLKSGVENAARRLGFSALQRAENFSIITVTAAPGMDERVSVLFSEPKISQFERRVINDHQHACFSALQRAENFSILAGTDVDHPHRQRFSALQRAENFSIRTSRGRPARRVRFQCSSASRKFLNSDI